MLSVMSVSNVMFYFVHSSVESFNEPEFMKRHLWSLFNFSYVSRAVGVIG